jgi:3-methylcrotonyl-CoA carboxylase alpha subunit
VVLKVHYCFPEKVSPGSTDRLEQLVLPDHLRVDPGPDREELAEVAANLAARRGEGLWSAALGFRLNAALHAAARLRDDRRMIHEVAQAEVDTAESSRDLVAFTRGFVRRNTLDRHDGGNNHGTHDGDALSSMPSRNVAIDVTAGQAVIKWQKLLPLVAMRMEHSLTAPFDGIVANLTQRLVHRCRWRPC